MLFGYDSKSKCLFSWDSDFRYEGKVDSPPEGSFVVESGLDHFYKIAACRFLSGSTFDPLLFWSDGVEYRFGYNGDVVPNFADQYEARNVSWDIVCLCGPIVASASAVSFFCRKFPCCKVYVCPLVEELAAFGILAAQVKSEKPRRVSLFLPNENSLNAPSIDFDSNLNGDGYGKMANIVSRGMPVFNEMMIGPGISPFYGRVLRKPSARYPSRFLVSSNVVDVYFPTEVLSLKKYAATSVFVETNNTKEFSKASECSDEKVFVAVTSDYIPGLPVFMNFHKLMSDSWVIGVSDSCDGIPSNIPVFRYNKGYRL